MKTELKPCPFCGRKPRVFKGFSNHSYQVACPYKTCSVEPMTSWREKKENAISDWNRRA